MNNEQLKQVVLEAVKSKLAEIAAQSNTTETLEETTVEEEINEEEVVEEAAVDEGEVDERRKKVSGKGDPKLAGGRRGYTADTGEKINEEDAETVTEEETVEEAEESAPLKEWYEGSLYGKLTKLWAK